MNDVIDMLYEYDAQEWVELLVGGILSFVRDKNGIEFHTPDLSWTDNNGRAWDDLTDEERAQWTS